MNNYSGDETVNAGSGEEISIRDLAALVARIVGFEGRIVWDSSRPNGTPRKLLDISKVREMGWKAMTGLEEGIALAYEDFLANPVRTER
jgi:GDP-L-fucose synthase